MFHFILITRIEIHLYAHIFKFLLKIMSRVNTIYLIWHNTLTQILPRGRVCLEHSISVY